MQQTTEIAIDGLKTEGDLMKARLSPQFVQRIEKTLGQIQTLSYDLEVVKLTSSQAAPKKDLDLVDQKFNAYTTVVKFNELQRRCDSFVIRDEVVKM